MLKSALAAPECTIGLIVSADWYDNVVRQDPGAQPEAYRAESVTVKETATTAWMRLFEPAVPVEEDSPEVEPSVPKKIRLADELLSIPVVRDRDSRRMLLELLPRQIADAVPYNGKDRLHVINLVNTCLDYDGGLQHLITAIQALDGGTTPYARAIRLVKELSAAHGNRMIN